MMKPGTISEGTLRTQDLLAAFADTLETANDVSDAAHDHVVEARLMLEVYACFDDNDLGVLDDVEVLATNLLEELREELEAFAPDYCYFGAHEGDGALFGFWVSHESIDEAIHDRNAMKVDDLSEVPDGWIGDVFHVSDHGNLTLYRYEAEDPSDPAIATGLYNGPIVHREIWAIV